MRDQFVRTFVFGVALLCATSVAAQQAGARATVTTTAPIFLEPGAQTPLRVAKAGTALKVLQEEGEWVEVEFNDPQFGRRVGWVQKKFVQRFKPELEPMDLSVRDTALVRDAPRAMPPTALPPQQDQNRLQPAREVQPHRERGWFDVNFGAANSAQESVTTEVNISDSDGELNRFRVGYNAPAGAAFDFGAGVMFSRVLGFGIQFTGTTHQGEADLSIRIPHPLYFNAYATDDGVTDRKLDRVEGAVNLSLVAAVPSANDNVSFRVYGGPTCFRLEADAVDNIKYSQVFGIFTTANSVEITGWESEKVEETAWGFHIGADLRHFFNRHVGLGGFARITRGTVTFSVDDFTLDNDLDVKVGGFQAGGGLRIRF